MGTLASSLQPLALFSSSPRVYADANVPAGIVGAMRHELGWDVLFVIEHDDLRRASDREHFVRALDLGRTLITLDRDFENRRRFPPDIGPGVVVCSAPDEAGLLRLLRYVDRELLRREPSATMPLRGRTIVLTPDQVC